MILSTMTKFNDTFLCCTIRMISVYYFIACLKIISIIIKASLLHEVGVSITSVF